MAFQFKLEHADGTPADPPTFKTAVPNWQAGDTIPLGRKRFVVAVLDDDPDRMSVLIVEEHPVRASGQPQH